MTARAIASVALGLWLTLLVMPMGGVAHAGERVCGNGIIETGETCDPPGVPAGADNECRDDCTFCGDNRVDAGVESCDDGNNDRGDGCENDCYVPLFVSTTGDDSIGNGSPQRPFRTIQEAFRQAADLTKIVVMPGTYNECVRAASPIAADRPVQIVAEDWITAQNNQTTIITGTGICDETQPINSRAAVVSIASSNSSIEGFTITGGGASGINAGGSVAITNNVITDNMSTLGGGIYFYSTSAYFDDIEGAITNNTITGNRAEFGVPPLGNPDAPVGGDGGGIFVYVNGGTTMLIDGNLVQGNTIRETSSDSAVAIHGGGIGVFTNSGPSGVVDVVITNNTISSNTVASGAAGYGGGAWFYTFGYGEETITVTDNSFQGNTANLDGGAISAWVTTFGTQDDSDPTTSDSNIRHTVNIENNTLRNNAAFGNGGALDLFVFARNLRTTERVQINARNNGITGNSASGGFGGGGGIVSYFKSWRSATPDSKIAIEGNTITGNTSEVSGGGIGVITTADPNPPSDIQVPLPPPAFAAADVEISGNLIANNDLTGFGAAGGGIFAFIQAFEDGTATVAVEQSTVASNTTAAGAGGIHVETFIGFDVAPGIALGQLEVDDTIVDQNGGVGIGGPTPALEDGILAPGDQGTGNLSVTVAYSDVFGHPGGEYSSWVPDRTGVNGNISEDPRLDGAGIPAECSPTIDTADPGLDFSAEPAPDGGRANMGHTGGTGDATPSLPDLNGDGVVDGIDMLRLSVSFGSSSSDARYNGSVDVNGDGSVDGDDLALVAPDYGMSCD